MLSINNVSRFYEGSAGLVKALKDISVEVQPGDFVVVQGASGCGKTTLLLTAGAMLRPTSGLVTIKGQNPYRLSNRELERIRREEIGFVFQNFNLIPYLSVLENVMVPAGKATNRDNIKRRAGELLERFNLTERMYHKSRELSTGEQQRAALARALINEPSLVLADEPTGNLDGDNGKIVLQHLSKISENGTAVVVVTHEMQIMQYAHKRYTIEDGVLVERKDLEND